MKWSSLKRFYGSTSFNNLFFATFTTLISLVATNILPSMRGLEQILGLIDYENVVKSLLVFFMAAFVWYLGVLIYELGVPIEISSHFSVRHYVDAATSSPLYTDTEERVEIAQAEIRQWHEMNSKHWGTRLIASACGIAAATLYFGALVLFVGSLHPFLARSIHPLLN